MCTEFDFENANMSGIYYFALAPKNPTIKTQLMNMTGITTDEYAKIYNTTDENSLGSLIS